MTLIIIQYSDQLLFRSLDFHSQLLPPHLNTGSLASIMSCSIRHFSRWLPNLWCRLILVTRVPKASLAVQVILHCTEMPRLKLHAPLALDRWWVWNGSSGMPPFQESRQWIDIIPVTLNHRKLACRLQVLLFLTTNPLREIFLQSFLKCKS